MRVLIVKTGEALPIGAQSRAGRSGLLATALAEQGHEVVWLTSTFEHGAKRHVSGADLVVEARPGLTIHALWAPGYLRHRSLRRLIHHAVLARKVDRWFARAAPADVVVAAIPVPELAACATRHARRWGVPSIVDCRDLWPDVFLEGLDGWRRAMAAVAVDPMRRATSEACKAASAICGHTEGFVEWGVAQSGRPRRDSDRSFPLAYPYEPPTDAELAGAAAFLDAAGVPLATAALRVTFIGTITRHFDLRPLVTAARGAHEGGLPVEFVVCGDGDRLALLRREAAGLPNVKWLGWQTGPVIWALLRRSGLGLAPYAPSTAFSRSIPNKVIEYLSARLPIISSLEGVTHDLLDASGAGWTYDPRSKDGLLRTLKMLLGNPRAICEARTGAERLFQERFEGRKVYRAFAEHVVQVGARGRPTQESPMIIALSV